MQNASKLIFNQHAHFF